MNISKQKCIFATIKLQLVLCFLLLGSPMTHAEEYFNPALLMNAREGAVADLSKFEQGFQLPGNYKVDVYLNDDFVSAHEFNFTQAEESSAASGGLIPCLDSSWLFSIGVQVYDFLPEDQRNERCVDLQKYIPEARVNYNFSQQRVDLTLPQIWLKNEARGYIPPSEWDEGITAGLINYNLSGSNSSDYNSLFLSLNSGFNFKGFRLRNFSSFNYSDNSRSDQSHSDWNNIHTFVEKSIIPLKSELLLGDSYTNGGIFESVGFRGLRLYSSDAMLPNTMQGYAPVIRGVASSKGTVTVRQNGYVVYQMNVAPGPFEIHDLAPMDLSGDLNVTVEDGNGVNQSFVVPYSGVPILIREGRTKFDVTAGEFRSGNKEQGNPFFVEGTVSRGLAHGTTVYSGAQLASDYQAVLVGMGKNMGNWGAFSFDATHANSRLADEKEYQGQSYRFLYSKSLNKLGTTFQLLSYRYSTRGFYTLNDVAYKNMERLDFPDYDKYGNGYYDPSIYYNLNYTKKGLFQLNINQNFEKYGSLYARVDYQTYWNSPKSSKNYQVGYSQSVAGVNYNLSWNLQDALNSIDGKNNTFSASVSFPMSAFFGRKNITQRNVYSTTSYIGNSNGSKSFQTGINGQLLDDDQLNYSVNLGHNNETGSFGSAYGRMDTRYGSAGLGFNFSDSGDSKNIYYDLSGGMIIHSKGITLGQNLGDTNILVDAQGAKDVKIENSKNIRTNSQGFAIISYAENYRLNRVALEADSLNDQTEILTNVQNLVPMKGAVLKANFKSRIGYRALFKLNYVGGEIPYGATVSEDNLQVSSLVGLNNKTFLSGLGDRGVLKVTWGTEPNESCNANYDFAQADLNSPIVKLSLVCQ